MPALPPARARAAARRWLLRGAAIASLASVPAAATPAAGEAPPKRVLVLESFGRDFSPYNEVSSSFRTELARRWPGRIEFLELSLESVSFETTDAAPAVAYLRALEAERRPDIVVTNAGPAAAFWLKNRNELAPGSPTLLAAIDDRYLASLSPPRGEVATTIRVDFRGLLREFLELRPATTEVLVVFGASPLERYWSEFVEREWAPLERRVRLTFTNDLPFDEVVSLASALPPRSAVFFGLMLRDARGIPHEQRAALARLHATATAPIFGWYDSQIGRGAVGGRLIPVAELGGVAARAAERILLGQDARAVPSDLRTESRPVYDGRELRRWGIDEKRLPPGSEVRYRPPTFLEEYRWHLFVALAVIVAQGIGIAALLEGKRRQRRAEQEMAQLRRELAHAGRVSVMGQLASSLAHELAQPLGAILRNAEAAELFLRGENPDLEEIRAILADIRNDDHRAGDVISRMRGLLKRRELDLAPLDAGRVVEDVVELVRPDAVARGVVLELGLARDLPAVLADQVHLQQVLLNLLVNAMDAVEAAPRDQRRLTVTTRPPAPGRVEIAVADTGPGIPPDVLPRLFEPFFTTKPSGMGMGLPICRTLVEAHGGTIEAENRSVGGATFRVTLPARHAASR